MRRIVQHGLKLMATLFGIVTLFLMVTAWALASIPFQSVTLTPYFEKAIASAIADSTASVGSSIVTWDHKKQLLAIELHAIELKAPDGQRLVAVQDAGLKLKPWRLLGGEWLAQEINADHAHFSLRRLRNGLIGFTPSDAPVQETQAESYVDLQILQFIADEIADPQLKHRIAITNISFDVKDELYGADWSASIPSLSLDHDKERAQGSAEVLVQEKGGSISTLALRYDYDQQSRLHDLLLRFKDIKPAVFAAQTPHLAPLKVANFPISGDLKLRTDRDLNINEVKIALDAGKGEIDAPDLWEKKRPLEGITLRAAYTSTDDMFRVSKAEINFGGPKLNVFFDAKIPPPKDVLWLSKKGGNNIFNLKITIDDLPMDEYANVWPKPVLPDARNWIVTSLSKGQFNHGEVSLKGKMRLDDLSAIEILSGGGFITAKGGRVDYLTDMPPVEDADARATFDLNQMNIEITAGHTGPVKIQPFTLVISKFQQDIQEIDIPIRLEGPVSHVLKVLDSKPLGFAKAIGLSAQDSAGHIQGTLTLHMPLLDSLLLEDVNVNAKATITGFAAQKLVSGIVIGNGNLALDLNGDGFTLKGAADLNNVNAQINWQSAFSAQKNKPLNDATITATIKGEQLGAFYGLDSIAKVEGETPVTIKYTNPRKGFSTVSGQVILNKARVRLRDIGWDKPAGELAQVGFMLEIPDGKNLTFRSIDIQGPQIKVRGSAELDHDSGKLLNLAFKPIILGRSNATLTYQQPLDPKLPLTLSVEGESFDLHSFEEGVPAGDKSEAEKLQEKEKRNRPKNYNIQLQKLYTSEDGFMTSIRAQAVRDDIGWKKIDLYGLAQGATPVSIKLLPEGDRLVFHLDTDNFGTALQGMGHGAVIKGGKIEIYGASSEDNKRRIDGKIKIESFVVTDLPVLARLLSAVSPFGFMDLITGDAAFDRLAGNYKWLGDDIDLSKVRAAGSVVGINLDGRMNIDNGEVNWTGTLVPFSFVNSIIGAIPLLGDVITGGSGGGVIAASYSVKGNLGDPDISVNPVSLITPGILRSIFFESDDGTKED